MPPTLLRKDPEFTRKLQGAAKSTEYFLKHREEYRGKWVVIHNGRPVGADSDPVKAKDQAKRAKVDLRECIIEFVPEDDDTCFY